MNKNKKNKSRRNILGIGCLVAGSLFLAGIAQLGNYSKNANVNDGSFYMRKIDEKEYAPVTIQEIQSDPEAYNRKLVEIVDPVWRKFIPIKGTTNNFIDRNLYSPDERYGSLEHMITAGIVPQGTPLNPLNPYENNISCVFTTQADVSRLYETVVSRINLDRNTNPQFTDHTVLRGIVKMKNDGSPIIYGHSITIGEDTYHLSDLFYGQAKR